MVDISLVEKIIDYKFKNKELLKTAFVHTSYANEHNKQSNQRLEYLGDAVLELVITDKLYRLFNLNEGTLTKYRASLVSEPTLAFAIEQLGLDKMLLRGKGESKNKIDSKAIKCDLFEAIVGAIYLDGGLKNAQKWILSVLGDGLESLKTEGLTNDSKSALQEMLKNQKIVYSTTKHGEDHNPHYKSSVIINGVITGFGEGSNKKSAEQMSAKDAISKIKKV